MINVDTCTHVWTLANDGPSLWRNPLWRVGASHRAHMNEKKQVRAMGGLDKKEMGALAWRKANRELPNRFSLLQYSNQTKLV